MTMSYDVTIYKLTHRRGKKHPYGVRWRVNDRQFSQWYTTEALADSERSGLIQATRRGEGFDSESGWPESKLRELRSVSWFVHAVEYIDRKWRASSAKHRVSMVETLVTVTVALVSDKRGGPAPETLRAALRGWAFNPKQRDSAQPEQIKTALSWVAKAAPAVNNLDTVRRVLDACATNLDGSASAPAYFDRRRRVLTNVLKFAVAKNRLAGNPLADPALEWEPPTRDTVVEEIDPRVVGSPEQIRRLLTAVEAVGRTQGPRFVAFFACMYYGMLRPAEVSHLREQDCRLPSTGWGLLLLEKNSPAAGKAFTDDGETHDERGLKGRGHKDVRPVPIPPELVAILRAHIEVFGTGPGGLLFRSVNDRLIHPSTYWHVWKRAREIALTPEECESPLMRRPYDLRHGGVSLRLYAGVPGAQVAEWAGHSLEVLQKTYAKVVAGFEHVWFQRIDQVLDNHPVAPNHLAAPNPLVEPPPPVEPSPQEAPPAVWTRDGPSHHKNSHRPSSGRSPTNSLRSRARRFESCRGRTTITSGNTR
ncbi:tyrosine-type recombinase/integrase [Actinomadura decatromicini]|uniref:Tyrosine-type recombinase/integrase n=1 Tax=Actinomadura decatromicini TaxID=2604572 RepID=A0A5D3FY20_9ACTN|nr:tyrosine-type recombinase/integrase [Actinomadura decatromicini]TYK53073.1 tyrosine-type recombinase/integrase [Actinomadura decatromicini]